MNKIKNLFVPWLALFLALAISNVSVASEVDASICSSDGVVMAFFNGVQTTELQAIVAVDKLRQIHGQQTQEGEPIRYELMYNYTEGFGDFVEVFEQRLQEQGGVLADRYELFWEANKGGGSWWSSITDRVSALGGLLDGYMQHSLALLAQRLTTAFASPPTAVNYAEHRVRIDNWVLEGKKLLFVAHSQGNLFVNPAYDYARQKAGPESVKVVHVAPASPILNGPHVLADLDDVIFMLRATGTVSPYTDEIPIYPLRPKSPLNNKRDFMGHGFLEIYINPLLNISQSVSNHIKQAINTLEAGPAQASTGFFTATLTWDGPGDVDLHVTEPDGNHVYFARKVGNSGHLDVDNTWSHGPEHYYASCQASQLQPGIYNVRIANYDRAEGRVATVQLASWQGGVLGTMSVRLGEATRSTPAYSMFRVNVQRNESTGQYAITSW